MAPNTGAPRIKTHNYKKNTLESSADENKNASTKHDSHPHFLQEFQTRIPKHWNWYEYEVRIRDEVGDEGYPNDGHGIRRLTYV